MNLCCNHEIAKIDCWLTSCYRHFASSFRYAKTMTGNRPTEEGSHKTSSYDMEIVRG